MLRHKFMTLLVSTAFVSASVLPRDNSSSTNTINDGIHLAVGPNCGNLSGAPSDLNAGLGSLSSYKTIVSFGDSYSDGGVHNGSALLPAIVVPPNPKAGGRSTNGPVWVEDIANDTGAALQDYATSGALIDVSQWAHTENTASDFVTQINTFVGQGVHPDPNTTLYTVFFGIEDFVESDGTQNLTQIGSDLVYNLVVLSSSPTFAKNILVIDNYGRGNSTALGDEYKQTVFSGLQSLHTQLGLNVGFVDLKTIWDGVLGTTPGYKAFGYTSPGACLVNDTTTDGACSDPEHTFYWLPGNPSKETHRLIADYVEEVFVNCTTS